MRSAFWNETSMRSTQRVDAAPACARYPDATATVALPARRRRNSTVRDPSTVFPTASSEAFAAAVSATWPSTACIAAMSCPARMIMNPSERACAIITSRPRTM